MKKLFLALFFIPALHGYSIKVEFSDGVKTVDTAVLDQFESTKISSLFPLVHKRWPKQLKDLDSNAFNMLVTLSKLEDHKLFNFFATRKPDELKLLYFYIKNLKIDNKLREAMNMALLKKNDVSIFSSNKNLREDLANEYLYDYYSGKVYDAKKDPSFASCDTYEDAFYSKYYGNPKLTYARNFFTALLYYHEQVLKKPLVIDTEELKEAYMFFDAQTQNFLVNNKFVTLT